MHLGYINMAPPQHEMVIKDCKKALKLSIKYIKALNWYTGALKELKQDEESPKAVHEELKLCIDYQASAVNHQWL